MVDSSLDRRRSLFYLRPDLMSMGRKPVVREPSRSGGLQEGKARPGRGPPPSRHSSVRYDEQSNQPGTSKGDMASAEELSMEDNLGQDPGYDADVEVVRPYAIEEPDDDETPTSTSTRPATPRLLDSAEYLQNELVNSLRDLYCDSDSNEAHPMARPKRGRKRKTATTASSYHNQQMVAPETKPSELETRLDDSYASPKRLRRRSGKSAEDRRTVHSALSPNGSEVRTGSNSSRLSPAVGGMEQGSPSTSTIPPVDRMDID